MLVDSATIFVRGGRGGNGCLSLRREKYRPRGGPDGGDGGDGGDVVLVGDPSLDTLLGFKYSPHFAGGNGRHGQGKSMRGADGRVCEVRVPVGTVVRDAEGPVLGDVSEPGQRLVVARGGRGGLGNEHFKTATRQTPRIATGGEEGEERMLRLELKLIADVGLVGRPNAGKSTLLAAVSKARPKVADYPFTTRTPHLGIAALPGERRLVLADIPGLIEGAAAGAGLGHEFLRHVERTRVLVHLVEIAPADGTEPLANYRAVRRELAGYSEALLAKPELVALSKLDLVPGGEADPATARLVAALSAEAAGTVLAVSAATGAGVPALLEACWKLAGGEQATPARWRVAD